MRQQGQRYWEQGRSKEAIPIFTRLIDINPQDAEAYLKRADSYRRLLSTSEVKKGLLDIEKALTLIPRDPRAHLIRGRCKATLNQNSDEDYRTAWTYFQTKSPLTAEDYYMQGLAKEVCQKDPRGAIEDYDQAIRLNPESAAAYFNRGRAKKALKDYRGAIEDYTQAIRLNPEDALAYYNRGRAKKALKDYRGAIEDFNHAIRLNPEDAAAYVNRGLAKYDLKDHRGAIEDFNHAIRLNPEDAAAYNNRGNAKKALKDYRGAIEDYTQALRIDPNHELAPNNRESARKALAGKKWF